MIGQLIRDLTERGVKLELKGKAVVVKAPAGAISPDMKLALRASKPELIARMRMPEVRCPACSRAVYWRGAGAGPWRCLGCEAPGDFDVINETVIVNSDWPDGGPFSEQELIRRGAVDVLVEAGVRLFRLNRVPMAGVPREADSPEVRSALILVHGDSWLFLDDPRVPERYRSRKGAAHGRLGA